MAQADSDDISQKEIAMIGDVKVNLVDENKGKGKGEDGIHCKVGLADGGEYNKPYRVSSYLEAKHILKSGLLLEAILQWYNEFDKSKKQVPPVLWFVRVKPTNAGRIGEVDSGGLSAKMEVEAMPPASGGFLPYRSQASYMVKVLQDKSTATKIQKTIGLSIDAGVSFPNTYEVSLDVSGSVNDWSFSFQGLKITLKNIKIAGHYKSGDVYKFSTFGGSSDFVSVVNAVKSTARINEITFLHVMGCIEKDAQINGYALPQWVTLHSYLQEWDKLYHHHMFALVEGVHRHHTNSQKQKSMEDWAMDLITAGQKKSLPRVVVVPFVVRDNKGKLRNLANVASAKLAAARVHESPGFVDKFGFLTVTQILDLEELLTKDSTGKSFMDVLDEAGYLCVVEYADYQGLYFSHGNTLAAKNSDFKRVQVLRAGDKIRRLARRRIMRFLESPSHPEAGIGGIATLTAEIDNAIGEAMEIKGDREIDSHETMIDPEQDVLGTGKVEGKIKFKPIGTMEQIELDVSTSNK